MTNYQIPLCLCSFYRENSVLYVYAMLWFFHNQIWQEILQMLYNVVLRYIEELLIELLHLGSILLIIIFLCCQSWEKKFVKKNIPTFIPCLILTKLN